MCVVVDFVTTHHDARSPQRQGRWGEGPIALIGLSERHPLTWTLKMGLGWTYAHWYCVLVSWTIWYFVLPPQHPTPLQAPAVTVSYML